jgi:hypothetical protein
MIGIHTVHRRLLAYKAALTGRLEADGYRWRPAIQLD